jgi:hypothetical protein
VEVNRMAKAKRGRPPKPSQPNALSIRGSAEWREFLVEFADHQRTTPTGLIDAALAELARRRGFRVPPKRI